MQHARDDYECLGLIKNNAFAHLLLQCSYFHDKRQRTELSGDLVICFLNLVVSKSHHATSAIDFLLLKASLLRNHAVAAAQTMGFA